MEVTHIENDEVLYRCIFYGRGGYIFSDSDGLRVTRDAFRDPQNQPSVDRAIICQNNPQNTQIDNQDGVVWLITAEVRVIQDVIKYKKGQEVDTEYLINVLHRPLENNFAHAQIEADPTITSSSVFRRLKTSLMHLVNNHDSQWLIYPGDYRTPT